jgi:hypothetical protein
MARRSRKIKRSRLNRRVSRKSRKVKKSRRSRSRRSRKVRRTRRKRMRGGAESSFPWKTRKEYGQNNPNRLRRLEQLDKMTPDEILTEIEKSKATGEFDAMLQEYLSHMHHPHVAKYPNFLTAEEVVARRSVEEGAGAYTTGEPANQSLPPGARQQIQSAERAGARFALNATLERVGKSEFKKMDNGERKDAILEEFDNIELPHTAFEHIQNDLYLI